MTAAPVIKAASGGLTRRMVQTLVIITVLSAATAAAALGVSLLTNANEAFLNGFAAHHGADVSVTVDTSHVTGAQLAATRHVPGVTQVGPYPELSLTVRNNAPARAQGGPAGKPGGSPHDDTGGGPGRRRHQPVHGGGPYIRGRPAR